MFTIHYLIVANTGNDFNYSDKQTKRGHLNYETASFSKIDVAKRLFDL